MTQKDILNFIFNNSTYTSSDILKKLDLFIQSSDFHKDSFLEPVKDTNSSLLIHIFSYSYPQVAYECMRKLSQHHINWFEKYEVNSYIDLAIFNDNVDALQFLIEHTEWKEEIKNYKTINKLSSIYLAAEQNSINCLTYLIEGLKLNYHDVFHEYGNALTGAVFNGSIDCAQYLIENTNIDRFYDFGTGHNLLFSAISNGNPLMVKYLIELNLYDLNATNKYGKNLFNHLLEETSGINSFDYVFPFFKDNLNFLQNHPLPLDEHYFLTLLENNNHATLFMLLENIEVDLTKIISSVDGQDLLMKASLNGDVHFIEFLIEKKQLNPRKNTLSGENVLTNAVSASNEELVQYYLDKGYHLDLKTLNKCFDILNQKKERVEQESELSKILNNFTLKNQSIYQKLTYYYNLLQEKENLENQFLHQNKSTQKKLKV